jgi:DNA-binding transcriptional regulator of glucitol operon
MFDDATIIIIFLMLVIGWGFQSWLTYRQMKKIQAVHRNLCEQYSKNYCISVGKAKARFIGRGCMVLVVVDRKMKIIDCRILHGALVFDQLKQEPELIGSDLSQYLSDNWKEEKKKNKKTKALSLAADHALSFYNEHRESSQSLIQNNIGE